MKRTMRAILSPLVFGTAHVDSMRATHMEMAPGASTGTPIHLACNQRMKIA